MENCEEKLYAWLKIGAKDRLSVGPTKSGPGVNSPAWYGVPLFVYTKHRSTQVDERKFTTLLKER